GGYAPSCEQGKHSKTNSCSNESCGRVPFCKRQLSRWRCRRRRLTAMPLLLARLRGFVRKPPTTTRADHSTTPAPSRTQADTRPPQSRPGGHGADTARPSAEGRGRQRLEPLDRGRPNGVYNQVVNLRGRGRPRQILSRPSHRTSRVSPASKRTATFTASKK